MTSFVNIKTLFTGSADRTVNCLKEYYNDVTKLMDVIKILVNGYLPEKSITGKKVLLKPNWVIDDRQESDKICLRTNDNFTLAVLEIVLQGKPEKVIIGDAPIQGCEWENLLSKSFLDNVNLLSNRYNTLIELKDFRRTTFDPAKNNPKRTIRPISEYIIFDLGKKSYLEPISNGNTNLFRVTEYNPDRIFESHRPGVHKYCITKDLFDSDLIISLPKVKTHQKAGLTNALKNIVGLNGDKDYLPHHRFGGTDRGGDCYPGDKILLHWAELILDCANRRQGKLIYPYLRKLAFRFWRLSFPNKAQNLGAGWYGNDTTWRMIMDLNLIAEFGLKDGKLSEYPQRTIYNLSDGIIGGQGEGPLRPEPLALGVVCFSNIPAFADLAMNYLMGFDYHKIPLLKAAIENKKDDVVNLIMNDKEIEFNALVNYSIKTKSPLGWSDHL